MKFAVCLKRIPAPDGNIRLSTDGCAFDLALVEQVTNPPDEHALEAALRLRAQRASSRLLALSVGAREHETMLRAAMAVGADEACLVEAPGVDCGQASVLAAAALRDFAPDLVFCGNRAVDDGLGFFPAALAEALGLAHIAGVCAVELNADGRHAICRRRMGGGEQRVEVDVPAVIACDRMAHELRTPLLKARLESKKRPLTVLRPEMPGGVPAFRSRRLLEPPERKPKRILTAGPGWTADEFLAELRDVEGLGR